MRVVIRFLMLLLVLIAWTSAISPQDRPEPPSSQSPYVLVQQATKAYDNKQYAESFRLFDAALAAGLNVGDVVYNAACHAALAGDSAKALAYLDRAIRLGFRDAEQMKVDTDLASIRSDARFQPIVERAQQNEQAYQREHSDPNRAAIVTSDIDLFWDVYPSLLTSPYPEALIENEYFRRGSPGLQDFIFARIESASDLWSTMNRAPKYYAALRPETLRTKEFTPGIRDSFRRMKELYPPATFPDVYFLIGRMNSAGTTGSSGLLIGADMFGKGPNVSMDELDDWHRAVVSSVTTIPSIVAHELVHYEQGTEGKTLLASALHEGSADLIGEMISGGQINGTARDYGLQHESELWAQFKQEMHGTDTSHWMYEGKVANGRPADLAYFMGYRIAEAYYYKASDKKQAIADILNFKDVDKLLNGSGYAQRFEKPGVTQEAAADPVRVENGLISGATDKNGVTAYLGIPFAAPPVGDLRWQPPHPPTHWDGVRQADHFGASCMQDQAGSRLPWTEEFMTQGPISEDCLFLNVWTAAKSATERQAVMVFIYGGGFSEGSSSVAVYNGAALAKKGVVVVTLNYRVGPLGFLVYSELTKESEHHSSGNYGLLDQIAALQWVQKNIAAFGGDPTRVTIFGQSAGAISVADLMRSPLAKGLFARAIAQSGPGLFPENILGGGATFGQREQQGLKYAESKGAHSLADLRAMPAADFFKRTPGSMGPSGVGGPVTDGWVIPAEHPGREVPLMVGMVAGDAGFLGGFGPPAAPTVANYTSDAQKTYGEMAATFLKLYPAATDGDVSAAKKASQTDRARVSIDAWCENQVKRSGAVYTYFFDHPIPWPAHPEFGAFHTSEVPYIFQTLKLIDRPWQPADFKLSETLATYWSNFAKTGNPNGADSSSSSLPKWPAYEPDSHTTVELGDHVGPIPEADPDKVEFFRAYLKK